MQEDNISENDALKSLLDELDKEAFVILDRQRLMRLLNHVEIIREEDTLISDSLRIMKINDVYLTQEVSNRSDIILRKHPSLSHAEELFSNRMDIYEKMWNGCGCKINYYDES